MDMMTDKEKKELEEFAEMIRANARAKVLSDTGDHWDLPERYRETPEMVERKASEDAKKFWKDLNI